MSLNIMFCQTNTSKPKNILSNVNEDQKMHKIHILNGEQLVYLFARKKIKHLNLVRFIWAESSSVLLFWWMVNTAAPLAVPWCILYLKAENTKLI